MNNQNLFVCPACENNMGFKNVAKVADNQDFRCPHCGEILTPKQSKTWRWGFIIGSLSVAVPAKVYLEYFQDNIFIALMIGALCGAAALFGICVYVYRTTIFTIK